MAAGTAVRCTEVRRLGHTVLALRMQSSLLNFLRYNVAGGGESARYGVEPPFYYFRSGLLNFNAAFVLALAYGALLAAQAFGAAPARAPAARCVAIMPLLFWFTAISLLPHKEERFLYVVYPQARTSGSPRARHRSRVLGEAAGTTYDAVEKADLDALPFVQ